MTTYPNAFAVCEKALSFYADWAWEDKVLLARERFTFTGMPEEAFEAFLVGWMLQEEDYSDMEEEDPSTPPMTEEQQRQLEAAFGLAELQSVIDPWDGAYPS